MKMQYMLAPIEDITTASFRTKCFENGVDLTFTPMARFSALARNSKASLERIKLVDDTPTMIQLIGTKEAELLKFLSKFKANKGFKGFNLNLGCPSSNYVSQGAGCAMIKRISKVKKLVSILKDYPVSIKLRLGLNKFEKEKKVYLNLINSIDVDFFIVHARHGSESYDDKADWDVFPKCVDTGRKIVANGDIKTKKDVSLLKSYGCYGVMIGRAAIENPRIFSLLK